MHALQALRPALALQHAQAAEFYKPYADPHDGKRKIAQALDLQVVEDTRELERKRKGLESELRTIEKTTRKLLDNISPGNREMVNRRLEELAAEKAQIQAQIDSISTIEHSADEQIARIDELFTMINAVESTIRHGPVEEAQAVIRKCLNKAEVFSDDNRLALSVAMLPSEARHSTVAAAVHDSVA
jgi:seryl-tRNA synthetase